jgi:hypothetical protein
MHMQMATATLQSFITAHERKFQEKLEAVAREQQRYIDIRWLGYSLIPRKHCIGRRFGDDLPPATEDPTYTMK